MYSDYLRMYHATMSRESNPNYEKSFKAFQKTAAVTRKAFKMMDDLYQQDQTKILEEYSTSKASEMLADLQGKYTEARREVENELKTSLDSVIESKRESIRKACTAPSSEDINLLAALNMRSRLSEKDIVYAAENIGNNLVALGTLADIANRHQINLPIPTTEKYEEQLEAAANYARSMIREVLTPDRELSYKATEFYNYPDAEGFSAMFFNELDTSPFTSEQKDKPATIDLKEFKKSLRESHAAREKQEAEAKANADKNSGSVAE